jgi:cathepsin A (carboxypeptidase C)
MYLLIIVLIISWMGNEAWTEALEWPGAKSFHSAAQHKFKVASNGKVGGVYKGAEGLTFLRVSVSANILSNSQVFGAGHMYHQPSFFHTNNRVPYDQPESSLEIFNAWLGGKF